MKIKRFLIERIIKEKLPKSAILIYLQIVKRQDNVGFVDLVHYTDLTQNTGVTKRSFYNAIKTLEEYGYITKENNKRDGFYTFNVEFNTYLDDEDFKSLGGYLNLNDKDLDMSILKNLNPTELKIVLYSKTYAFDKGYVRIGAKKFCEKIGIKDIYRFKEIISKLKDKTKVYNVVVEKADKQRTFNRANIYMNVSKKISKPDPKKLDKKTYEERKKQYNKQRIYLFDDYLLYAQKITTTCRKNKIDTSNSSIKDNIAALTGLVNQYHEHVPANTICNYICELIVRIQGIEEKLIHKRIINNFNIVVNT